MNKSQLVKEVSNKMKLSMGASKDLVGMVLKIIADSLATGEDVSLQCFGNFVIKEKKPYIGRNPSTGESLPIPAKTILAFRPGTTLKEAIQKGGDQRRNPVKRRRTR